MNEIENKAREIIADLVLLDPSLKDIETELSKLVINFIKNKPNIIVNDGFEEELRSNIINEAKILKEKDDAKKIVFDKRIFIKKLSFSFGAIVLAVLIIFPGINLLKGNSSFLGINKLKKHEVKISQLDEGAFGTLIPKNIALREENRGLLKGANLMTLGISDMKLDDNINSQIKFIYEGDDLLDIIPQREKLSVYRRDKISFNNSSELKSITAQVKNYIDLKHFINNQTNITKLSFNEDKEFGYNISLNLAQGSLFITQNRDKWPQASAHCQDEECYLANQFKYEDLLANEESIKIAEEFLKDLGINKDNYGQAIITNDFHEIYRNSEYKEDLYIPEETIVTFPFIIDGKEVKDESANPYGLVLSVSSRHKKVTELSNFFFSNYQSSAYKTLNDPILIQELAEQETLNNYQDSLGEKDIVLKLGTPSLILSKQDRSDDGYENSEKLFIPSLSFPVLELSQKTDFFIKKYVIVPLIKELIDIDN